MRKAIADSRSGIIPFNISALQSLKKLGYKFVQVRGLTPDNHYEYTEPCFLLLVPIKELPSEAVNKDIYEPIESDILTTWATEKNDTLPVFVSKQSFK